MISFLPAPAPVFYRGHGTSEAELAKRLGPAWVFLRTNKSPGGSVKDHDMMLNRLDIL